MRLAELFVEGGFWMYPIALLNCALVPLGIVLLTIGVASKQRNALVFALVLLGGGLLPAMLGELANVLAMQNVDAAIAYADPADQATIRAAGMAESMTTVLFGLSGAIVPVFCGFVLLGVGLGRLPRFEENA